MAEQIENKKGFLVLKTSQVEILSAHPLNRGICDSCNKASFQGHYVAVLNYWMCPNCYDAWYKNAIHYKEDHSFEKEMFQNMCKVLGVRINYNQKKSIKDGTNI